MPKNYNSASHYSYQRSSIPEVSENRSNYSGNNNGQTTDAI